MKNADLRKTGIRDKKEKESGENVKMRQFLEVLEPRKIWSASLVPFPFHMESCQ